MKKNQNNKKQIKKQNKKPIVAIAVIAIVGIIGATIAYFTTTTTFRNVFSTATYQTVSEEVFESPTNWTPGTTTPKQVTVKNEGSIPVAVRVSYVEEWTDNNDVPLNPQPANKVTINFGDTTNWKKSGNYYYYTSSLAQGNTTSSFIQSVKLNEDAIDSTGTSCTTVGSKVTCTATDPIVNAKYTLTITTETIQYDAVVSEWGVDPTQL